MAPTSHPTPTTAPLHVTLLTRAQCVFCDDARVILGRLTGDFPLVIETVDLGSPAGVQLALRGGVFFPPGIFLDGELFSYGRLSERKLRQEFERRRLARQSGHIGTHETMCITKQK